MTNERRDIVRVSLNLLCCVGLAITLVFAVIQAKDNGIYLSDHYEQKARFQGKTNAKDEDREKIDGWTGENRRPNT